MIIVSQDKTMIFNYENIEAIGIREPDDNGNCAILVETVSDNQYPIAEYKIETRAKEVLQEIVRAYSNFEYFKNATNEGKKYIITLIKSQYKLFDIYEMPENRRY